MKISKMSGNIVKKDNTMGMTFWRADIYYAFFMVLQSEAILTNAFYFKPFSALYDFENRHDVVINVQIVCPGEH